MKTAHPPRPRLNLSVGITGHRPPLLDDQAEAVIRPLLRRILAELADAAAQVEAAHRDIFSHGAFVPRFVSPLAEGADQLGAEVALELGFALDAVLPLPRDDYRTDFEPAGAARFDLLLQRADKVLEMPPQRSGRDANYALAGRATIAHADVLIALWDGEAARGTGGTADVVALALRNGLPVIHLSLQPDQSVQIYWTGYADYVDASDLDHMPYRDADSSGLHALVSALLGPPDDPHAIADLKLYLNESERLTRVRAEFPLLLALLRVKSLRRSAFSSERYEEGTRAEWQAFHQACGSDRHGVGAELKSLERSFAWADHLAQHFGQAYRSGQVLNFTFGALAVLTALAGLIYPHLEFLLALLEPSAIALIVLNTLIGSKRQWHRRWLEYRQLAERIRPMRSLKLLGIAASPVANAQDGKTASWIDWYARAEWRASGAPQGRMRDPDLLVQAIVAEEIMPQVDYNHASGRQMHLLDHRLHNVGIVLFILSILSCAASIFVHLFDPHFAEGHSGWFIAASAGLPAVGGAIFGIRMHGEFGSTAERAHATANELDRIVRALTMPQLSLLRQADLAEAAATAMLADLIEWRRAYERRTLQVG